ncbi:tetratricopeptide repeat protein [Pseudotenacibaculum sp. MALMAid0570]|uniref:tetratricopeptide repeat protein n=1 Tax=Pseudotenacibaculum sp. MALMAid0570 TaxID=3143938 RepID=UPI0032DE8F06
MKQFFFIIALFLAGLSYSQNNFMLGEDYFRQGEYKKAAQIYESLLKKNPFNTTYLKRLATCFQETDQYQKAENLLRSTLERNPAQKYLHVEIGYNYERQQKLELAKKEYDIALNAINTNPSLGGIIGRMFRQNNSLDNAIASYKKTMELNNNANYQFQIAQIYGEKGDFEKMFDSYIELVNKNENYIGTVQRLSSRYITDDPTNKNNISLKRSLLRRSISNPKNVWNELLSWLFAKQKEYSKSFIQEKALFKRNPEYLDNMNTLGKIAYNDNDFEAAKECFSFILKNTNFIDEKVNAELFLLRIAVKTEDDKALNHFEKVLKTYGVNSNTIAIQIEYADFLTFKKNNPTQAESVLENALRFSKSKFQQARIKLKIGEVLVFTGKFNKALIYFSQVQTKLKNHPLSQQARFKVAQTSYFKGDFKWAMAQLKVLKGSTTQLIANDAVDLFLVISDNEPKDSIPSGLKEYAKADLLAYQNKDSEALAILKKIHTKYQGFPVEDEALFKEAHILIKLKKFDEALLTLAKVVALDPEGILNDDVYYLVAELYNNELNMPEKAKEYYQKIIFEYPSSIHLVDARRKYRLLRGDSIN